MANLQSDLIQLGINERLHQPLEVNGTYDQPTRHAVLAFQLRHGIREINGVADQATREAVHTQASLVKSQDAPGRDVSQAPPPVLPPNGEIQRLEQERREREQETEARYRQAQEQDAARYREAAHANDPRNAGQPQAPSSQSALHLPFSDPNHRQHALYADVQHGGVSPAAGDGPGARPRVDEMKALFQRWRERRRQQAVEDLQSVQETMQQVSAYDQQ